ncbi:hypothetical protein VB711_00015 [Cronbergia sp. UHCC 0137]|uniref:hypothetical protein n=1 Tax=Cronbergia sp. UHCC 0137 TaxID=3110239 RepID=UPI002B218081|nr:hypothetical protein [Cronbergia sp. UHCC 0137]MEA5616228.1 hypothetical protein [Cronbergia sp. UHCC 0137]
MLLPLPCATVILSLPLPPLTVVLLAIPFAPTVTVSSPSPANTLELLFTNTLSLALPAKMVLLSMDTMVSAPSPANNNCPGVGLSCSLFVEPKLMLETVGGSAIVIVKISLTVAPVVSVAIAFWDMGERSLL